MTVQPVPATVGAVVPPGDPVRLCARAVALVLDLPGTGLRADTPLADLGLDDVARLCVADVVEELAGLAGVAWRMDDAVLADAGTLAELAGGLRPVPDPTGTPPQPPVRRVRR